jgi:hypothetical protein
MNEVITECDKYGNVIFYAATDGSFWWRKKYDERGNCIFTEDYAGFWVRKEYDEKGNETRFQNYLGIDTNNC